MRELTYAISPGCSGRWQEQAGALPQLLRAIPYFMTGQLIPPLAVVNDVLRQGQADAGMSGAVQWQPFQIDAQEHRQLVERLIQEGMLYEEPPAWVDTRQAWSIWFAYKAYHIPCEEHQRLWQLRSTLREQMEAARKAEDWARFAQLADQDLELGREEMAFLERHRRPNPHYLRRQGV